VTVITEQTRTKMISFRLTAEEYSRFSELCSACGTPTVSELARGAIKSLLNQPAQVPREALESRVAELEGRINKLGLEFKLFRENGGNPALEEVTIHE
jgi:hypothetical protein